MTRNLGYSTRRDQYLPAEATSYEEVWEAAMITSGFGQGTQGLLVSPMVVGGQKQKRGCSISVARVTISRASGDLEVPSRLYDVKSIPNVMNRWRAHIPFTVSLHAVYSSHAFCQHGQQPLHHSASLPSTTTRIPEAK